MSPPALPGAAPRPDGANAPGDPSDEGAALSPGAPAGPAGPARPCRLEVPLGRRMVVLSDLLLGPEATPASRALTADVARTLAEWQGPGVVIVAGNLFDGCGGLDDRSADDEVRAMTEALDAHAVLKDALCNFTRRPESRVLVLPGWRDPLLGSPLHAATVFRGTGVEVVAALDTSMTTAAGERRVLVRAGAPAVGMNLLDHDGDEPRPWLSGINRLEDPTASRRFVNSRTLYRRLRRYLWIPPLVVGLVALAVRLPFVFDGLKHVVRMPGPRRALTHAYAASWGDRALFTLIAIALLLAVLAAVVALTSRGVWRALGGGTLPAPWGHPDPAQASVEPVSRLVTEGDDALDVARRDIAAGVTGLVVGGGLTAELTHLDPGFAACPGGTTEIVREHAGRVGLPPVFLHHLQSGSIEIETGADLHVRLLLADVILPSSTRLERLVTADRVGKGYKPVADLHPVMAASWPRGASWPPTADVTADRFHVRRVRRIAAALLFLAGLVDLLTAVTPPLRTRLNLIEQVIPLGVAQAAGALVALAGIGLLMLARGVLRGQRRAWLIAVSLLTATVVFHVIRDADIGTVLFSAAVLVFLLVQRQSFRSDHDAGSLRSAVVILVTGAVAATFGATAVLELSGRIKHHPLPSYPLVVLGSAERLVGLTTVAFPSYIEGFVAPSLLALGIALVLVALFFLTRPVVDRRLSAGRAAARRAAELRSRDIVRRHGTGTLDYFALRDDKQWFFHRDSLVAYAVYGGVCLVSPDPIGPISDRDQVWSLFRQYADRHGWAIAVMGAGEEWLPVYRDAGMRHLYIGDEAVVDVPTFSLEGGKKKGLRQAVHRVARYGYTARFLDPAQISRDDAAALIDLMGRSRRGEEERGFSMMLGRLFDPRDSGLLLAAVDGPDGTPVAMCQFVPSPAIGGYSLDLMRRDPGEHPNGLLDFALCSTIDHLRERGVQGLSLNFAAMRSILEGETGDGLTQRVERWAIRRLSGVLQIESLWRFNAKYDPGWLPRYIVYDSAEQFVPTALQIMRAESLTEIPVLGRFLSSPSAPTSASLPASGSRNAAATEQAGAGAGRAPAP
jgi:lysylphosphatidylglycerol synthetase-like protein (DUF2156 family)